MRVLIVDDEPIARRRLQRLLGAMDDVDVVGEAGDVPSAVMTATACQPDVMLLDVQLPGGDGFDVIEKLGEQCPMTIFVTAFDHHALRAFEVAAADYVTKPVDSVRLRVAIERTRQLIEDRGRKEQVEELRAMVDALRQSLRYTQNPSQSFWVKSRGIQVRIGIETIDYVKAERDYVQLFAKGKTFLVSENITSIGARLAPHGFERVHRSTLVRLRGIKSAHRSSYGRWVLRLECGDELSVGRTYIGAIRRFLNP